MFIIWGFGKQTVRDFGSDQFYDCQRCHNHSNYKIKKVTTWFTLFFIPLIPYRIKYYLYCPICSSGYEISKAQFLAYTANGSNMNQQGNQMGNFGQDYNQNNGQNYDQNSNQGYDQSQNYNQNPDYNQNQAGYNQQGNNDSQDPRYAGKTETQINYLKQMEEIENERKQNNQQQD